MVTGRRCVVSRCACLTFCWRWWRRGWRRVALRREREEAGDQRDWERRPRRTQHRHRGRQTGITPTAEAASPADWPSGGRADGRSGRAVFVYELPGGFTVNGSWGLQTAWVWVKPAFSQRLQASAAINNVYVFTTDVSLYGHIWPLCVRACCLHWPSAIMFTRLQRMCECVCARVFVVLQNAARTWPSKESPVQTTSFSCELCSTVFVHLSICQCGDHWVLGSEDIYTYWGHFGFYLSTGLFWGFKFIPHTKKESLLMFALWIPPLLAEEKQVWSHFRNSQSDVTSFLK